VLAPERDLVPNGATYLLERDADGWRVGAA
jgi:hypothetical protein